MGDFRIVIESAGNHGCNRAVKEGEEFYGCGRMDCPDWRRAARRRLHHRPPREQAPQGPVLVLGTGSGLDARGRPRSGTC